MRAAAMQPIAKATPPIRIQLDRPVATYSIATNIAKNMSEVPRSCCTISTPIEAIHTMTIGPRSLRRGNCRPSTFLPPTASWSRWLNRYDAKKNARNSLANSPGCSWYEPMPIQMRAPPISRPRPGTIGDSSSARPTTMLTYEKRRRMR